MATIFTKIINGDIPCYKIAENENCFAFLDINPLAKGHTLVVPKQEVDYFFDLSDGVLSEMMHFAKHIAANIKAKTGCRKVAVVVLGLEVPHAHIHLIPMNTEADVNFSNPKLTLSDAEFKEVQKLIML